MLTIVTSSASTMTLSMSVIVDETSVVIISHHRLLAADATGPDLGRRKLSLPFGSDRTLAATSVTSGFVEAAP